jgi:hypothetical protein
MKLPLLIALAFLPGLALAQTTTDSTSTTSTAPAADADASAHHWHHRSPEDQLAWLTSKLDLTSTQQSQILPVLTARETQVKAIHQNSALTDDQKHEQMKALRQNTDQQIESFLTSGQLTQFEALHPHRDKAPQQ